MSINEGTNQLPNEGDGGSVNHPSPFGSDMGDEQPAKRGSKKWIGAAVGVAVVAGLAIGGTAFANSLGGGGAQPEEAIPANALAVVKLDLNPSAGQKLAVMRLAAKFPETKGKVTEQDTSIKQSVFGSLFTGKDSTFGLDYKTDVEPWLGDRAAIAAFPDADGDLVPEIGFVVAATDVDAAKAALTRVSAKLAATAKAKTNKLEKDPKMGFAAADGFVIISDTTANAQKIVTDGKKGAISASGAYTKDIASLAGDQIGTAWLDLGALAKATPTEEQLKANVQRQKAENTKKMTEFGRSGDTKLLDGLANPSDTDLGMFSKLVDRKTTGRMAIGLHADAEFIEVVGKSLDVKVGTPRTLGKTSGSGMITRLPADSWGAVSTTGLGDYIASIIPTFPVSFMSQLNELGLEHSEQIVTLLGTETAIAVRGSMDDPEFGVRTKNAKASESLALINKLLQNAGASSTFAPKQVDSQEDVVMASSPAMTEALAANGKLGDDAAFKQAVPDAATADMAAYFNLGTIVPELPNTKAATSVKPLKAFGATGTKDAFRMRLTVK